MGRPIASGTPLLAGAPSASASALVTDLLSTCDETVRQILNYYCSYPIPLTEEYLMQMAREIVAAVEPFARMIAVALTLGLERHEHSNPVVLTDTVSGIERHERAVKLICNNLKPRRIITSLSELAPTHRREFFNALVVAKAQIKVDRKV